MRRAVGFTFIGEGKSHGDKITAPFRVSEVSEGTEAARKLLVGDEIVQVDDLRGMLVCFSSFFSVLLLFSCCFSQARTQCEATDACVRVCACVRVRVRACCVCICKCTPTSYTWLVVLD
jgi:hypothetical protein